MMKLISICIAFLVPIQTTQDRDIPNLNHLDNIDLHKRSSTKTPYEYVANTNTTLNAHIGENCRPVQIWLVVRHGTRYPSKSGVRALNHEIHLLAQKFNKNRHKVRYVVQYLKHLLQSLFWCQATKINLISINHFSKAAQELIDKLLLWKPNTIDDFGEEHAKFLHHVGEKEQILIAERYAERFPSLLKGDYHPELFKFRSTYTQRYLKNKKWSED